MVGKKLGWLGWEGWVAMGWVGVGFRLGWFRPVQPRLCLLMWAQPLWHCCSLLDCLVPATPLVLLGCFPHGYCHMHLVTVCCAFTALPRRACTQWPQRNNASTLPPGQVKSMGLTNQTQWWTGQLPDLPLGRTFGGSSGMSGALGGGSVLVHCGGYDEYNLR